MVSFFVVHTTEQKKKASFFFLPTQKSTSQKNIKKIGKKQEKCNDFSKITFKPESFFLTFCVHCSLQLCCQQAWVKTTRWQMC